MSQLQVPPFDVQSLTDRLGDADLVDEIVALYLEQARQDLHDIRYAWQNKEWFKLSRRAHRLKGASASASALEMSALAYQLVDATDIQDLVGMFMVISDLEPALERFAQSAREALSRENALPVPG